MSENLKYLLDLDDDYEKFATEIVGSAPTGKCTLNNLDHFPPRLSDIDFDVNNSRHVLPAIFQITNIPPSRVSKVAGELADAKIDLYRCSYTLDYKTITKEGVIKITRPNKQQQFDSLVRKFDLKAKDIARMTIRKASSVYGWTSQRKLKSGKRLQIPAAPLELIRYKLGDKELIPHCANWRVAPEDRLTTTLIMWNGEPTAFTDLPTNEQMRMITEEYNLSSTEVGVMALKSNTVHAQWIAKEGAGGYREMPKAEMELILIKLMEKNILLDEKVSRLRRDLYAKTGLTR